MGQGEHVHGGDIWGLAQRDVIDFSANINPLGPPSGVSKAIIDSLDELIHYPDPLCRELSTSLATKRGIEVEEVLCGNGAVELIYLLVHWLRPKKALIPQPTFSEYTHAVEAAHGEVVEFFFKEEENFKPNLKDLFQALRGTDLLILCNPNNPTGILLEKRDLIEILKQAQRERVFVLIDEAFLDFLPDYEARTLVPHLKEFDNLMVLYSMTKFFSIPGLRLGAAFSSKEVIKGMRAIKDPWSVNHLAQKAGLACLADQDFINKSREHSLMESNYLFTQLKEKTKLRIWQPSVNYIFASLINYDLTSTQLCSRLLENGILIRNCNSYPGLEERYVRIAVKSRADNLRLVDELVKALEEV